MANDGGSHLLRNSVVLAAVVTAVGGILAAVLPNVLESNGPNPPSNGQREAAEQKAEVTEYQARLAAFCETAPAFPMPLAFFELFERYSEQNRRSYVAALRDYRSALRRRLREVTGERPPEALAQYWQAEQKAEDRYLSAQRRYTDAVDNARQIDLANLPASLKRQLNQLDAIGRELGAALVRLSGGRCS